MIIISDSRYNTHNEDVICCAITSNTRAYHNSVDIDNDDLDEGYLKYDSRIKSTKIFTLEQKSILKRLARLNITKSKEVIDQLNNNIAIEE